jgi:hypothetical protein
MQHTVKNSKKQILENPCEPIRDSKLLLRALIELNIARKNLLSYPEGHQQVASSLKRSHQQLSAFLDQQKELSIGVLRDGLVISGKYLEPGNAVIMDLAAALRERRIAGLSFGPGLSPEDIRDLLGIINRRDDEAVAGEPGQRASEPTAAFNAVRIFFIDYAKFHHTTECEISPDGSADPSAGGSIWQDYIQYLTADVLTEAPEGAPIARSRDLTPADLAAHLNSQAAGDSRLLKSYEKVIHDHLQRSSVSAIANGANYKVQEKFRQFIDELNPHLRKQFLSITFEQWQQAEPSSAESMLGHLPLSMVIDMLTQANGEGKEISPSLFNLVFKFAGARSSPESQEHHAESAEALAELLRLQSLAAGGGIFRREAYESFVGPEYDRALRALIPNQCGATGVKPEHFDLAAHLESLAEERLTLRIARALLALLATTVETAAYHEHAANLEAVLPDLADQGHFALILESLRLFSAHASRPGPPEISAAAKACLERFKNSKSMATAIEKLSRSPSPADRTECELLQALGPDVAPWVLNLYLNGKTASARELLRRTGALYPQRVASELALRLRAAGPQEFPPLLSIAALLDAENAARLLRPYLDHREPGIRASVLEALLRHRDPQAMRRLEALLGSRDEDEALAAVGMIGRLALQDMAPQLVARLSQGLLLTKVELARNERIISALRALGVGLPPAARQKLLRACFSLHPARLSRFKDTVRSLG